MPEAVCTIQSLDPPTGNQKTYKARGAGGIEYRIPTKLMNGLIGTGGTYKIFFEPSEFHGKFYNIVQSIEPVGAQHVQQTTLADAVNRLGQGVTSVAQAPQVPVRARTSQEDEKAINRRHRVNWVGERLDAFAGQLPLSYEELRKVANIFEGLYASLTVDEQQYAQAQARVERVSPQTQAHPGSTGEMEDEVPF